METISLQIFIDLMNSLQRFIKIGIYYPDGHDVAGQAAGTFLSLLNKIVGKDASSLRFDVTEETIVLQGTELDISLVSVNHFHELLHSLSVATLDMHRDITADELRLFLSRLLSLRVKVQTAHDFHQIKITGMPSTIKIHQKSFSASRSTSSGQGSGVGDSSQPTIDNLLSSLTDRGLNSEEVSACRQLLESIPEALEKRQIAESGLPSVTWDDVELLLSRVAKSIHASDGRDKKGEDPGEHQNIDVLTAILKSLEGSVGGQKSQEAVNLLVSQIKGVSPHSEDENEKDSKVARPNDTTGISIKELQDLLSSLKKATFPEDLSESSRSEDLSVLMQMLGQEQSIYAAMRVEEVLRDCLRAPLEAREWRIVVLGTQQLLKALDKEAFEMALMMMLKILRRSEHANTLIFLRDVCQGLIKEEFVSCWPFLVNECFIEGPIENSELFQEICAIVALLSQHEMYINLPRLLRLDALAEKRIAPALFSSLHADLKILFILLFDSPRASYLFEQLIPGLQRHPLGWLDQAVNPLLESTNESHQQFIVELLQQDDPDKPSKSLKRKGAVIVVDKLQDIGPEQRGQEWVVMTIGAMARVKIPEGQSLLKKILKSRRFLIIPEWPRVARRAAREALRSNF